MTQATTTTINHHRAMSEELKDEELIVVLRNEIKSVKHRIDTRKYRTIPTNATKSQARVAVSRAIRSGKLLASPCEKCGSEKSEAHHEDYSKPLEVGWLCKDCHAAHHRAQKTHCANGHQWVPKNIYTMPNGKRQFCLLCRAKWYGKREDRASELKTLRKEKEAMSRRIDELQASLTEMVGIYWGDGDGIEPPPHCIIRATSLLDPHEVQS